GGVEVQRLHEERELEAGRTADAAAAGEDGEPRHGDAVVGEELLGDGLVPGQQQAAGVAAGVGQLQQLQVGHHVLVEGGDVREALHQVEGDVGLELVDRRAQRT